MKNIFLIAFLCLGLVFILFAIPFLSGCSRKSEQITGDNTTEIDLSKRKDISSDELQKLIADGRKILLLDVRSTGEFNSGHIPKALNIPYHKVIQSPGDVPQKDHEAVIIYCESGFRAKVAQKALQKAGVSKVIHLKGDMATWRRKQLPTVHSN